MSYSHPTRIRQVGINDKTCNGSVSSYPLDKMRRLTKMIRGDFATWWRHQMKTFTASLVLCVGNSPVTCEFPSQRPITRSFDVFFDLHLNKRLCKQSRPWWFKTPSCSLSRHCNGICLHLLLKIGIWYNLRHQVQSVNKLLMQYYTHFAMTLVCGCAE